MNKLSILEDLISQAMDFGTDVESMPALPQWQWNGFSTWTNGKLSSFTFGGFVFVWGGRVGGGERALREQLRREDYRKFGNFYYYHFIFVFQLLGQAARNMVLQEDAILHSEDVRNNFCYDLSFMCTVCVASGKWNALFLSLSLSLFNAEFKKNGNNNNSSSVPVSMRSPVPAVLATQSLSAGCFSWPLCFCLLSWRWEPGIECQEWGWGWWLGEGISQGYGPPGIDAWNCRRSWCTGCDQGGNHPCEPLSYFEGFLEGETANPTGPGPIQDHTHA